MLKESWPKLLLVQCPPAPSFLPDMHFTSYMVAEICTAAAFRFPPLALVSMEEDEEKQGLEGFPRGPKTRMDLKDL